MGENLQIANAAQIVIKDGRFKNRSNFFQCMLALRGNVESADLDFAASWPDLPEHHPDGCAFAGSVVTKQSEDLARCNFEIKALHGATRPELLFQFAQ